ncbi:MAG: DUF3138 family protein [Burkholderiales bacterium]|nr:DUF3138 family protein [Burkholderiales bacterium]
MKFPNRALEKTGLSVLALAAQLAIALPARAQSIDEMRQMITELKARVEQLEAANKAQAEAPPPVDPEEFNRVKTKAEALEDQKEASGFRGLKISAGIDPAWIYSQAKGSGSYSFLNNFVSLNGSGESYSYDNGYFGLGWIDFQKELDGGTKFRLTLAPSKSAGSQYNAGNIVHEATASIPLTDAQTRLLVGQIPDFSGYESFFSTSSWNTLLNQNHAITRNLLFDFTAATFYTGAGLDLTRGPWEYKVVLGNFNSPRNDRSTGSTNGMIKSPTLVYNATYAPGQAEFYTLEFTGYEGSVPTLNGTHGRVDQFEIDGSILRGNKSMFLEYVMGQQRGGAFNGSDSQWFGLSGQYAYRFTPRFEGSLRLDYLHNSKNGGGTYNLATNDPSGAGNLGDFINGFGPGDPNAPGFDPNKGANRSAITFGLNYNYSINVSFRAEYRLDMANKPTFYYFNDGLYRKTNQLFGLQTVVSF